MMEDIPKTIEDVNYVRSKSLNCSPEMNSYHIKYEAAQQKIKYLEEKVDLLQMDLEKVK